MKLYYMPGACSLAPHIAFHEAGIGVDLVSVDYTTRQTMGGDFTTINPKGYVPAVQLPNGEMLTEVPVILQYIADQAPQIGLLPAPGPDRYRALAWLNFVATELHKSFSPLFRPSTPRAFLEPGRAHLAKRLDVAEAQLQRGRYLLGGQFSLADIYLFTVSRWLADQNLDIANWPGLNRHFNRLLARPNVQIALQNEGITGAQNQPARPE